MSFRIKQSSPYIRTDPVPQQTETKLTYADLSKNLKNPEKLNSLLSTPQPNPNSRPTVGSDKGLAIRTDIRSQADFF